MRYAIADETVFALCELVCGGLRAQLAELGWDPRGRCGMSGRTALGPVGRVGRYTATHFRQVLAAWVLVALVLGFFAPRVEKALSGAGWEATGSSQSKRAR